MVMLPWTGAGRVDGYTCCSYLASLVLACTVGLRPGDEQDAPLPEANLYDKYEQQEKGFQFREAQSACFLNCLVHPSVPCPRSWIDTSFTLLVGKSLRLRGFFPR